MTNIPTLATVPGVRHHTLAVDGATLHYVSAGTAGSPVLLVHGFPETWWTFHKLIPLLAGSHRVFAVDLRGFGESRATDGDYSSAASAGDLRRLIAHLDLGPVHITGQDIGGGAVFRLAATHPGHVRSVTAIEMGLAGFGLEGLADVTHGGSWHIGVLAAEGIPDLLLAGREREFLAGWAFPAMSAVPGSIAEPDLDEFARAYSATDGWLGASGLYRSMLAEGEELRSLAGAAPLPMPVLAVGAGGGAFTAQTMAAVTAGPVRTAQLEGVGHYVAMEDPAGLAAVMTGFLLQVDADVDAP